jgi:hypothetical protein
VHRTGRRSNDSDRTTNIGSDSATYVVQEADEAAKIRAMVSASDRDNTTTAAPQTSTATRPLRMWPRR